MPDQELVEHVPLHFDTIEFWHMIGVRAPASPHDRARIRRKTTSAARAWLTPPISAWLLTILAVHRLLFAQNGSPFSASGLEVDNAFATTVEEPLVEGFHCI